MKIIIKKQLKLCVILFLLIVSACSGSRGTPSNNDKAVVSTACNIEKINGQVGDTVSLKGRVVNIQGWSADSTTETAPEKLSVQLLDVRGNLILSDRAIRRISRLDVVNALNISAYGMAGFEASVDLKDLKPATYGLSIIMARPGLLVICQSNKKIILRQ